MRGSQLERHIQTVLAALAVSFVGWMAWTVQTMSSEVVRLQEQVHQVVEKLSDIGGQLKEEHTYSLTTNVEQDKRLSAIEQRVSIIESHQ